MGCKKIIMIENNKNDMPRLNPGERISVGKGLSKIQAVVCAYVDSELINIEGDIEVVYLDDRGRAINTGVVWNQDYWEFKDSSPSGGYADKNERLTKFVDILRKK